MALASTSYLTYRQSVARRLGDRTNQFWIDAELKRYSLETFRTFNSLAWYNRDRFQFNTAANTAFYDLPSQANTLLGYNLKDQDLFLDIKYNLIEDTSTQSAWGPNGTDQATLQDVQDALEKVRNDFLLKTGIVQTHQFVNISADLAGRIQLSDSIVHLRRVAYLNANNSAYTTVHRGDEFEATALLPGWQTNSADPVLYSPLTVPVRGIQLIPPAMVTGKLSIVSGNLPANLNITAGVLMNIPDDLAWIIRFGALAYLLSREGQLNDPQRAAYCKVRYDQGLQIAQLWNTVQQVMINGVPVIPSSIVTDDLLANGWQTKVGTGQPTSVMTVAPNLIALRKVPDAGPYSIQVDTVRNAPLPVDDNDNIQVQDEHIATLVDYTAHLAAFKQGGQEFEDTVPLMQNFLELCLFYNHTLAQEIPQLPSISRWVYKSVEQRPIVGEDGVQLAA